MADADTAITALLCRADVSPDGQTQEEVRHMKVKSVCVSCRRWCAMVTSLCLRPAWGAMVTSLCLRAAWGAMQWYRKPEFCMDCLHGELLWGEFRVMPSVELCTMHIDKAATT